MSSFFNRFASGELDSTFWHSILLFSAIFGDALVAGGVILESWPPKYRKAWAGLGLVFFGVIISAAFTVMLFLFDEGISVAQQSKIIALEARLAARTISDSDAATIHDAISKYKGQKFEVIPYWDDKESLDFANRIAVALIASSWEIEQPKGFTSLIGIVAGIEVYADPRALKELDVRRALVDTLNSLEFSATGRDENPAAGSPIDDKININVGIKP